MSKKLGNLVKEARTAKGLTQAALADKVGGITSSDVKSGPAVLRICQAVTT